MWRRAALAASEGGILAARSRTRGTAAALAGPQGCGPPRFRGGEQVQREPGAFHDRQSSSAGNNAPAAGRLKAGGTRVKACVSRPRGAFEQIAELAMEYKAGARSLRGIFEEMMTDVMYAVPDHPEIRRVVIRSLFEPAEIGRAAESAAKNT